MAKLKPSKINLVSQTQPPEINGVHTCPVAGIDFRGACANVKCPANIAGRRTNSSGCFYEKQHSSNIVDVSRWTKLTTHDIKRRYTTGIKKIEKFVGIYNFVINYREFNRKKCCPQCGVNNEHGLVCLNGKRCQSRQKFYQKYRQRFPFNVSPLNVTAQEFFAICQHVPLQPSILPKIIKRADVLLNQKVT
jgi:hypothetical protein